MSVSVDPSRLSHTQRRLRRRDRHLGSGWRGGHGRAASRRALSGRVVGAVPHPRAPSGSGTGAPTRESPGRQAGCCATPPHGGPGACALRHGASSRRSGSVHERREPAGALRGSGSPFCDGVARQPALRGRAPDPKAERRPVAGHARPSARPTDVNRARRGRRPDRGGRPRRCPEPRRTFPSCCVVSEPAASSGSASTAV